jgi:hypothetical protein
MKKRAVRTPDWKLIVSLEPDLHGFPPLELYDMKKDPGETENLSTELPEVAAELRARMDDHIHARVAETGNPDPLPTQPIPLRRIGKVVDAIPGGQRVEARRGESAETAPGSRTRDEKLRQGDFVGYERDPASDTPPSEG